MLKYFLNPVRSLIRTMKLLKKNVPTRPILQNQKSKGSFYLFIFFLKSPRSYDFWKFQVQGPNNQFGVACLWWWWRRNVANSLCCVRNLSFIFSILHGKVEKMPNGTLTETALFCQRPVHVQCENTVHKHCSMMARKFPRCKNLPWMSPERTVWCKRTRGNHAWG